MNRGTLYSVRHLDGGLATEITSWQASIVPGVEPDVETNFLPGSSVFGDGYERYVALPEGGRITFDEIGDTFRTAPLSNITRPYDLWNELDPCTREGAPLSSYNLGTRPMRQWAPGDMYRLDDRPRHHGRLSNGPPVR